MQRYAIGERSNNTMRTFYDAFLTRRDASCVRISPQAANQVCLAPIFAGRTDAILTIPSILLANRGPGFGNSVLAFYFCSVTDSHNPNRPDDE